jgi:hypothetical protein
MTDLNSSTPITFGQVLWKIIPFVFTSLLDQSVKCGHASKQSDNLCLLDSSLRERELTMIPDEYTELIQQKMSSTSTSTDNEDDLDNLFHLGQYFIYRIIESTLINDNETTKQQQQHRLDLSINPKDVLIKSYLMILLNIIYDRCLC